jgi:DNA-binding MarR family transcriptional regulator
MKKKQPTSSSQKSSTQTASRQKSSREPRPLTNFEYKALSEFRYQLRRYLRFMEDHARNAGLQPQQYQLLLAIKGLPHGSVPRVSVVAERMQLNHNTLVELAERCEARAWITRKRSVSDRRQVTLAITPQGEVVLRQQASVSRKELSTIGPVLFESLRRLVEVNRVRQQKTGQRSGRPDKFAAASSD